MLPKERLAQIAALVDEQHAASVAEASIPWKRVHRAISDQGAPPHMVRALRERGMGVLLV